MITCNLMGGLGNQLFQIYTTIAYSIKTNNQFKFLNIDSLGEGTTTIRYTFWQTFFKRLQLFLIKNIPQPIQVIREKGFSFQQLPVYDINRDIMLYGYFQSFKYFNNEFQVISKIIGIESMKKTLLNTLNYNSDFFKHTISIHFRLGDYKKIPEYHPILTNEYYFNSLNFIHEKYPYIKFNVMYFCDEEDINDVMEKIIFLQNSFKQYEFIRGDKYLADWEQLLLMSSCHHNIIANSSFSWWAAYFNNWIDKIVCYPSVWFGPAAKHNIIDLFPNNWNKIKV